jgi:hypothetical protein
MNLRQRIDTALSGLDGDTAPARKLCLGLARRLLRLRVELNAALELVHEHWLAHPQELDDAIAAARDRLARTKAWLAALEGETTAFQADPLARMRFCWNRATAWERAEFRRWVEENP